MSGSIECATDRPYAISLIMISLDSSERRLISTDAIFLALSGRSFIICVSSLINSIKGAMDITSIVVDVALVVALIPVIATFIANATNLTATQTTLLGLTTLFIILALVFNIGKQSGLIGKK